MNVQLLLNRWDLSLWKEQFSIRWWNTSRCLHEVQRFHTGLGRVQRITCFDALLQLLYIFVHKAIPNKLSLTSLQEEFILQSQSQITRHVQYVLLVPSAHREMGKKAFIFSAPVTWNSLNREREIKECSRSEFEFIHSYCKWLLC